MSATSFATWMVRLVPASWMIGLVGLMLLASILEGVGILLLVPFLAVLLGDSDGAPSALADRMEGLLAAVGLGASAGTLLVVFVCLVFLRSLVVVLRERLASIVQFHAVDELRRQSLAALLGAEWRWISTRRRSDYAALVTMEIGRVGMGIRDYLLMIATAVGILAYLVAAFSISAAMSAIALATGIVIYVLMAGIRRRSVHLGRDMSEANRAMMSTVEESLGGLKLAKILGTERRHLDFLMRTMARVRHAQNAFILTNAYAQATWQVLAATMLAAYIYAGISWLSVDPPSLFALVLIFGRLSPQFMQFQQAHNRWLHVSTVKANVDDLLAEAGAAAEPVADPNQEPLRVEREIRLDSVALTYAGRDVPALVDVSLVLPARTTTAIMGPSGAGKSSLADILVGLISPDSGRLMVDGALIAPDTRRRWLRSVSYIPQEVTLFHDTVRGNLQWGAQNVTDDDLAQALRRASADFVFELPQGLETVVGDGGMRLSGGERQRLAIARALLRRASLLILDEATSALDVGNEAMIHDAIAALHGDLTIVMIGHRLPMLQLADQVIILSEGRIVRAGKGSEIALEQP